MNDMQTLFQNFGNSVQNFLPLSPFRNLINYLEGIDFGWLNWFFPVGAILHIGGLWLNAILIFYVYQIILRWLKVIE